MNERNERGVSRSVGRSVSGSASSEEGSLTLRVRDQALALESSVKDYLGECSRAFTREAAVQRLDRDRVLNGYERSVAIARTHAATTLSRLKGDLRRLTDELLDGEVDGDCRLGTADYLRIGHYEALGMAESRPVASASNEVVLLPAVVPLLNRGNVVVRCGGVGDRADAIVNAWLLEALERTAVGQLAIYDYDPRLKGAIAPFVTIRSEARELVPEGIDRLDMLLSQLSGHVKEVSDRLGGAEWILSDMHRKAKQPIELYRLVVLRDFPARATGEEISKLAVLMESGPRCGVSFVITLEPQDKSQPELSRVLSNASLVDLTSNPPVGRSFQADTSFRLRLTPTIANSEVERRIYALKDRLVSTAAPALDFFELHSGIPMWNRSSAKGITAIVGRSGLETLSITLGDEERQQHNVLVSGAVGQGKSTLLATLIYSVAWHYSPQEVEMYLLDLKEGLSLAPLVPQPGSDVTFLPHARVIGLDGDQGYGAAVLEGLVNECRRRARLFRGKADNIARYRSLNRSEVLPRIIVMVDEFHKLFGEDERATESAISSLHELSRQGRAYGVHLLLASQTLSGISELLSKADGIFAQFPIRLALKNSQSESRVVLDPQNTAAAELRYRGEVVLNDNFGRQESNRVGIVANAGPERLLGLRHDFCSRLASAAPPTVFDGSLPATLTSQIALLKRLRQSVTESAVQHCALVGAELSLEGSGVGPRLTKRAGSHLAVFGSSALGLNPQVMEVGDTADLSTAPNLAVGVLLSAAVSLALQHPLGDAEFVILNLLSRPERLKANLDDLVETVWYLGCDAAIIEEPKVADFVREMDDLVSSRTEHDYHLYVIGLALDRVSFTQSGPSAFGGSPADALRRFVKRACSMNAHLLAWWDSVPAYREALGFDANDHIQNRITLSLYQDDVREVMGPRENWSFRENRGLLKLSEESQSRVIIPMAPPTTRELRTLREVKWEN